MVDCVCSEHLGLSRATFEASYLLSSYPQLGLRRSHFPWALWSVTLVPAVWRPRWSWPGLRKPRFNLLSTSRSRCFAHPKCPCTQATIQEFQRIEARHPGAFETFVVFAIRKKRSGLEIVSTRRTGARSAQRDDSFRPGGLEASRFQAAVSGQILLFSKDLHLLYSGGVTPARGHEGDNAGQEAFEYTCPS